MSSLATRYLGLESPHPFVLASASPTASATAIHAAAQAGWAGAITKSITSAPQYLRNLAPALVPARKAGWRQLGILNNELRTAGSLRDWCEREIPLARELTGPEFHLGVSVMEGPSPADWETAARAVSAAGASSVELNVSCPHGAPEKYRGSFVGDDPQLVHAIVAAACTGSTAPIAVKLNAGSPSLMEAAHAAVRAGASGLVVANTLPALPSAASLLTGSDTAGETLVPMGVSGPALLPINRLAVARLSADIGGEVIAVGGVTSPLDALDYLMYGASNVQIATAAIVRGLDIVGTLTRSLSESLDQADFPSVSAVRGMALPHVTTADHALARTAPSVAVVDMDRCILCNACVRPCTESAANCITMETESLIIESNLCTGCGLCVMLCPTDALSLLPITQTQFKVT